MLSFAGIGVLATFGYDDLGRRRSLTLANGASTHYDYDPVSRLAVVDSSNGALDASLGYDGQDIALEVSSGKRRRYIHGPWSDEPLMSSLVNANGTFRDHYHVDERGSIIAISDSTGTAGTTGKYDEYGVGTGVSHFHYTGQYWLVDAQLHYYKARIYDARLGRFLQPDPIGYGAGMLMLSGKIDHRAGSLPGSQSRPNWSLFGKPAESLRKFQQPKFAL